MELVDCVEQILVCANSDSHTAAAAPALPFEFFLGSGVWTAASLSSLLSGEAITITLPDHYYQHSPGIDYEIKVRIPSNSDHLQTLHLSELRTTRKPSPTKTATLCLLHPVK